MQNRIRHSTFVACDATIHVNDERARISPYSRLHQVILITTLYVRKPNRTRSSTDVLQTVNTEYCNHPEHPHLPSFFPAIEPLRSRHPTFLQYIPYNTEYNTSNVNLKNFHKSYPSSSSQCECHRNIQADANPKLHSSVH